MSKILIVADHADGKLNGGVAKVMSAAQAIGGDVDIVVFSDDGKAVAEQAAKINGVAKALTVDNAANANLMGAVLAPQIVELVKGGYTHVLFCGNALGKDTARASPPCWACRRCPTSWPCTAPPVLTAPSMPAMPSPRLKSRKGR